MSYYHRDSPDQTGLPGNRTLWVALNYNYDGSFFGFGYGGEGSAFPIINRQYFGRGPMGRYFETTDGSANWRAGRS